MPVVGNKTNVLGEQNPGKVKVKHSGSTVVIKENLNRLGLEIVNGGANTVYLYPGKTAVEEEGITLAANGGSWNGLIGNMLWTGEITGIAATAETTIQVVEV
jgi:hypothetical protein